MTDEEMEKCIESQNKRKAEQDIAYLKRIKARVPLRFKNITPYPTFPSRNKEKNVNGVFLTGGPGAGKSYLAARLFLGWVLNETDYGYGCVWWNVTKLLEQMRVEFHTHPDPSVSQKCISAAILVLDDLGSEQITEWTHSCLGSIISNRYDDEKPTIITSNLDIEEIRAIDARIASRINSYYLKKVTSRDRRYA